MRSLVAFLAVLSWAAPSLGTSRADARPVLEPMESFRFSAGSALFASPGLGRDGSVYVGSAEGYVHALASDGRYRWSYTVKGRIVAAPVEDGATGRVFVATSEARLYCFEPDAHLRWVFPLPVAPKTELMLTPKGTLLFVGSDDHLYGVTTSGALVLRLAAPGARSAPVVLASGQSALVLGDVLGIIKGHGYEKAPLPGPFTAAAKLALAPDRAVFACEDGKARVLGGSSRPLDVVSDCLSPPVRGDGFFAISEGSGHVRLVYDTGASQTLALGAAPLRPLWDASRRRLVLSTVTGSVRVLELPKQGAP
jgi:outer membrane protein assembly factor BamB